MKRLDEILYNMNRDITQSYGMENAVLKITLTHEAFDKMVFDMAKNDKYSARYSPAWMNDFEVFGVRIEARSKESKP